MPLHFFKLDPQNRQRLFWQAQAVGWGLMMVFTLVFFYVTDVPAYAAFTISTSRTITSMLLSSLLLRYILRWFIRVRMQMFFAGCLIIVCCAILGWLDMFIFRGLAPIWGLCITDLPSYFNESWLIRMIVFWMWSVLYFTINYWLNTQEARMRMAQLQLEQRMLELQQLRAQINPRFLFDAFNTLLSEAENPSVVARVTQSMSEFLRFSLMQKGNLQELGKEVEALKHYLRVEKHRLKEKFEYHIAASKQACEQQVPIMLIQPLVENAFNYGLRTSPSPLHLKIEAKLNKNELWITVANSGRWITPEKSAVASGMGLANIRRRLELVYSGDATCSHEEKEGWVYVIIRIPMNNNKRAASALENSENQ
jgi:two-component system LytT family sensor kinase